MFADQQRKQLIGQVGLGALVEFDGAAVSSERYGDASDAAVETAAGSEGSPS